MVVTDQTKQILGVMATVVEDTVSEDGKAAERTFDWYAQDKQGNVWYMGEDSLELKNGKLVPASGSWESGVNGALPGFIMPGNPQQGAVYRQEYFPAGEALDQARIVRFDANVPAGAFKPVLATEEFSPVEPQFETKYYAAGIGEVEEKCGRRRPRALRPGQRDEATRAGSESDLHDRATTRQLRHRRRCPANDARRRCGT
jgi:hypothetical protein